MCYPKITRAEGLAIPPPREKETSASYNRFELWYPRVAPKICKKEEETSAS